MTPARAAQLGLPSAVAPGRPATVRPDPLQRQSGQPRGAAGPGLPVAYRHDQRTSGSDILLTNTGGGDRWSGRWARLSRSVNWGLTARLHLLAPERARRRGRHQFGRHQQLQQRDHRRPEPPGVFTSDYQILYEHRFTINYSQPFIGDNRTSFRLFLLDRAGLPFSYAFCTTSSSSCTSPFVQRPVRPAVRPGRDLDDPPTALRAQDRRDPAWSPRPAIRTSPMVPASIDAPSTASCNRSGLIRYAGSIAPRNAFRSLRRRHRRPADLPGVPSLVPGRRQERRQGRVLPRRHQPPEPAEQELGHR